MDNNTITAAAELDTLKAIRDNITTDPNPDTIRAALDAITAHAPETDPAELDSPRAIRAALTDIINAIYWDIAEDITAEPTTEKKKEEVNTMKNTITAEIITIANRIINTQGGYREKHLLKIPHEYQRGETWNKNHKVVYVLNKARDLDGYRAGCAVDIVTKSIVG
jgi:hypothetical protein